MRDTRTRRVHAGRRSMTPMAVGREMTEGVDVGADVEGHLDVFGEHLCVQRRPHGVGQADAARFHPE